MIRRRLATKLQQQNQIKQQTDQIMQTTEEEVMAMTTKKKTHSTPTMTQIPIMTAIHRPIQMICPVSVTCEIHSNAHLNSTWPNILCKQNSLN